MAGQGRTVTVAQYDAKWARAITGSIQRGGEAISALVLQAHDERAWATLGYASWGAYVDAEFGFARSRSYQLLAQGRANKRLADGGSKVRASEREARDLSTTVDSREIEREITERRSGPVPKPSGGGRKRPMGDSTERLRVIAEEVEQFVEQSEGEAIEYVPAEMRRAMGRQFERIQKASRTMVERLAQPQRRGVINDD